jgi:DNA-binding NarL/FixJ family response regulator
VLRLAAVGQNNQEIARSLVRSVATVKPHVSIALAKLGVRDRI